MKIRKEFFSPFYRTYVFFIILCLIVISFLYIFYTWNVQKERLKTDLHTEAHHIEDVLKEIFLETSQLMAFVGKEIIGLKKENDDTLESIENLLSQNPEAIYHIGKSIDEKYQVGKTSGIVYYSKIKRFPSWRNLGWIPPHNLLIINPKFGLPPKTVDMSFRDYLTKGQKSSWKLHLTSPDIGIPSGLWEIPGGMGITDKSGKYIGTISVGFTISELNTILRQIVSQNYISYLVLDETCKIVLQSPDNACDPKKPYYPFNQMKKDLSLKTQGYFDEAILHKGISYFYFQKMQNYPYIILIGYREDWLYKTLFEILTPRLVEFICMGIFCLILLHIFRNQILLMSRNSEKEKEKFLDSLNNRVSSLTSFKKKNHFMPEILNFSHVDVQKTIKECIVMSHQKAFLKNVSIIQDYSLKKPVCSLYIDELCFKQIVLSLIYLSFNFLKDKGMIIFSCELKKEDQDNFLHIYIEDNGIPLDKSSLTHLQKNYNYNNANLHEKMELPFEEIELLVKIQGGICLVKSKEIGKVIELIFPCKSSKVSSNISNSFYNFDQEKNTVLH